MKCIICKKGKTEQGNSTMTLERDEATVIIKEVPSNICTNCGEEYFDDDITERVLEIAENAFSDGIEVDIRRYKAA